MPKSFFWIDQKLIRSGLWLKLTVTGKLFYVALSAACDRDGRCHWGRAKLMELVGGTEHDFESGMAELSSHGLIRMAEELGCVELLSLDDGKALEFLPAPAKPRAVSETQAGVIVHTHLTVELLDHVNR